MFTGIITDVGRIVSAQADGEPPRAFGAGLSPETTGVHNSRRLKIACGYDMATVDLGASIACSGVCLTVVDKGNDWFAVDVSAESVSRTAPGMWDEGRQLNLERSLKLGDELGGHIVTGHVDGLGFVSWGGSEGNSIGFSIKAPKRLAGYITEKGSIAVDGISLTVNEVEDRDDGVYFGVNIIPHTAENTALFDRGSTVNIEIDILARYIGRMLEMRG